eukprot:COSAG05_NODE_1030_length_6093_cov_3.047881_5_plen_184_part_01
MCIVCTSTCAHNAAGKAVGAVRAAEEWVANASITILPYVIDLKYIVSNVSEDVHWVNYKLNIFIINVTTELDKINAMKVVADLPNCTTTPCLRTVRRPDEVNLDFGDKLQVKGKNFYRNFLFPIRYSHLNDLKRQLWHTPGMYDNYTVQAAIPLIDKRTYSKKADNVLPPYMDQKCNTDYILAS